MEDLTAKVLDKIIDDIIKNHQNEIAEKILSGADDSMSDQKIYSIMLSNCLSLSMKLTSQFLLELLQSQGILRIDERELQKLLLKMLSSEIRE